MDVLNKLIGRHPKREAIGGLAAQFDEGKNKVVQILLEGLSDPELQEREHCAQIIRDRFIPALDLDPGQASRAETLKTLQKLMIELRPPKSDAEMSDLNNAAFYYMMRKIQK